MRTHLKEIMSQPPYLTLSDFAEEKFDDSTSKLLDAVLVNVPDITPKSLSKDARIYSFVD